MAMEYVIGIDLGSTNFRIGAVSADGRIHSKHMSVVGRDRRPDQIAELLAPHVADLKKSFPNVLGVGIGIPGIVDKDDGVVHQAPHFPEWRDVNFRNLFSGTFDLPVVVDNDANMFALGEGWLGAGKGMNSFLMITLGTGIGGGVFFNGSILHGDKGFAGEVGHILIEFEGPPCNCGSRGCLEMYASATGIKHLVESSTEPSKKVFMRLIDGDLDKVTPERLFELAREGDIFSSVTWKQFGTYLGAGIAGMINTLGIFNVVIGGGVSRAWDFFIAAAEKEFKKRTYRRTGAVVRFLKATLGHDAGVLGSARTILQPECD